MMRLIRRHIRAARLARHTGPLFLKAGKKQRSTIPDFTGRFRDSTTNRHANIKQLDIKTLAWKVHLKGRVSMLHLWQIASRKINLTIFPPISPVQANNANNSSVFACIKASSPRDSTFNRTSGSVLEHRKLNRQLPNSMLRPSVKSTCCASF